MEGVPTTGVTVATIMGPLRGMKNQQIDNHVHNND